MANKKRISSITPAQIIDTRNAVGLSQTTAAALMQYSERQWRNFETGKTAMSEAIFNSFQQMSRNH